MKIPPYPPLEKGGNERQGFKSPFRKGGFRGILKGTFTLKPAATPKLIMPHFRRTHQGVILLLGAALLFLWAWRSNFWMPAAPAPPQHSSPVFVEITGVAANPGVYSFNHPPTLLEAWRRAGGPEPLPNQDHQLPSGTRLEITKGGAYRLSRMRGPQLLTLGLFIDLNSATQQDLEALPGIGPALAGRILAHRRTHGPFRQIEDLEQVSGVGPKKLAQVKPYLTIQIQEASPPDPE